MVAGFSKVGIHDILLVQGMLAGELAARAANRMTKVEIDALSKIQVDHEKAVAAGRPSTFSRTGHQVHRAIDIAARSLRRANLLGSMIKQLPNRLHAATEGHVQDTLDYHPRIPEAICARNAERARQLTHDHLVSAANHLIELLEHQGIWASDDGRSSESSTYS